MFLFSLISLYNSRFLPVAPLITCWFSTIPSMQHRSMNNVRWISTTEWIQQALCWVANFGAAISPELLGSNHNTTQYNTERTQTHIIHNNGHSNYLLLLNHGAGPKQNPWTSACQWCARVCKMGYRNVGEKKKTVHGQEGWASLSEWVCECVHVSVRIYPSDFQTVGN